MLKFLLCFHWFIEFSNEKGELFWIVRRCIQHEGCLLLGGEEECMEHFLIKKKEKKRPRDSLVWKELRNIFLPQDLSYLNLSM